MTNDAKLIKIADKLSNCWDLQRLPPPSWSKERVEGYLLWAWAVCRNLKGVNQKLDEEIDTVFNKAGVTGLTAEDESAKLVEYYKILAESKGEK